MPKTGHLVYGRDGHLVFKDAQPASVNANQAAGNFLWFGRNYEDGGGLYDYSDFTMGGDRYSLEVSAYWKYPSVSHAVVGSQPFYMMDAQPVLNGSNQPWPGGLNYASVIYREAASGEWILVYATARDVWLDSGVMQQIVEAGSWTAYTPGNAKVSAATAGGLPTAWNFTACRWRGLTLRGPYALTHIIASAHTGSLRSFVYPYNGILVAQP